MALCKHCEIFGECSYGDVTIVTPAEVRKRVFLFDLKLTAHLLHVSQAAWLDHVYDLYGQVEGCFRDEVGNLIDLNLEVFSSKSIEFWFRDNICKGPDYVTEHRVRSEALGRYIVLGSILKAHYPGVSAVWGQRKPANDNEAPRKKAR